MDDVEVTRTAGITRRRREYGAAAAVVYLGHFGTIRIMTIREGIQIIVESVEALELVTARIEIAIGVVTIGELVAIIVDFVVTDLGGTRRVTVADGRFRSVADDQVEIAGTTLIARLRVEGLTATASVELAAGLDFYQQNRRSVGLAGAQIDASAAVLEGLSHDPAIVVALTGENCEQVFGHVEADHATAVVVDLHCVGGCLDPRVQLGVVGSSHLPAIRASAVSSPVAGVGIESAGPGCVELGPGNSEGVDVHRAALTTPSAIVAIDRELEPSRENRLAGDEVLERRGVEIEQCAVVTCASYPQYSARAVVPVASLGANIRVLIGDGAEHAILVGLITRAEDAVVAITSDGPDATAPADVAGLLLEGTAVTARVEGTAVGTFMVPSTRSVMPPMFRGRICFPVARVYGAEGLS